MAEWLTTVVCGSVTGLADFGLITHASVDVFWSRGYEQDELCSRLYFNADSHYSVQAAFERLQTYLAYSRLCKMAPDE